MVKKGKFLETVESIGIALLIALAIRAFVLEPFKIPSPSMVPTLLIGDQIFVNKFVYGLRVPFTKKRIWDGRDPKRGEVVIFLYPKDENLDYIKRVVGMPGDRILVDGDKVIVNGEPMIRESLGFKLDPDHTDRIILTPDKPYKKLTLFPDWEYYNLFREEVEGRSYLVQFDQGSFYPKMEMTVPPGHYFVMGDNRDHSADSREWGFVPRENIKGRAMFIWLSFDWERSFPDWVRWHRFGRWIY